MPSHPFSCNTIFKVCINDEVVHAIKVLASVSIPSNLFFLLFFELFCNNNKRCVFLSNFFGRRLLGLSLPFISHWSKPITRTLRSKRLFPFSPYREASNTLQTGKEGRKHLFFSKKKKKMIETPKTAQRISVSGFNVLGLQAFVDCNKYTYVDLLNASTAISQGFKYLTLYWPVWPPCVTRPNETAITHFTFTTMFVICMGHRRVQTMLFAIYANM